MGGVLASHSAYRSLPGTPQLHAVRESDGGADISTDDAQLHCLKITSPKLVLVDVGMANQLGGLKHLLKAKKVGDVYCWSSVAHLPKRVRKGVQEIGDAKSSPQLVQDVINGVGLEQLGPESDGIIFFTSGWVLFQSTLTSALPVTPKLSGQVNAASSTACFRGKWVSHIPMLAYSRHCACHPPCWW